MLKPIFNVLNKISKNTFNLNQKTENSKQLKVQLEHNLITGLDYTTTIGQYFRLKDVNISFSEVIGEETFQIIIRDNLDPNYDVVKRSYDLASTKYITYDGDVDGAINAVDSEINIKLTNNNSTTQTAYVTLIYVGGDV